MKQSNVLSRALFGPCFPLVASVFPTPLLAAEGGFLADSSATLQARNYYFSRDYSDIVGGNPQSRTEEWAQGFILNFKSGYTPGDVGLGLDAIGLFGVKLDSSHDLANSGLLPVHNDGHAADEYSRMGAALKLKVSKTELKVGEQQVTVPVLYFGDIRLLPPTYQGASIVSNEIPGLTLQTGQMRSTSLRNESGEEELGAMVGFVPRLHAGKLITTDRFNYAGADYVFNANRTSMGIWYSQLKDIYHQRYFSLKHSEPVGDWTLGATVGYFDSAEDGEQMIGKLDNRAAFGMFSARHGGHSIYFGYQAMFGKDGLPRVFANTTPMSNNLPTYVFDSADERSWQARYDYDFAVVGAPGLVAGVRYVKGYNVDTGRGFEGKDWERDLDISYVVQGGPLKGLAVQVRNAIARSNYVTDVDENRLVFNYTWKLF